MVSAHDIYLQLAAERAAAEFVAPGEEEWRAVPWRAETSRRWAERPPADFSPASSPPRRQPQPQPEAVPRANEGPGSWAAQSSPSRSLEESPTRVYSPFISAYDECVCPAVPPCLCVLAECGSGGRCRYDYRRRAEGLSGVYRPGISEQTLYASLAAS